MYDYVDGKSYFKYRKLKLKSGLLVPKTPLSNNEYDRLPNQEKKFFKSVNYKCGSDDNDKK